MKKSKIPPIIFVYEGDFPSYGYDSILINSYNTSNSIILICDTKKIDKKKFSKRIKIYDTNSFYSNLNNLEVFNKYANYRNGFWIKALTRFFILNKFAEYKKLDSFYHLELDNIISDISSLHLRLDKFPSKIFFSCYKKHGYGSFVYINKRNKLKKFCNFSLNQLKKKFLNDMELLGLFSKYYPKQTFKLPTIDDLHNEKKTNIIRICGGIFDEARVGVFLFGHDPRNYCNIVMNRRAYLTDKTSFATLKKIKFQINKKQFFLFNNNKKIIIYNFHIHSKLFSHIFLKKKYKKIIKRINKNLDTIITYNIKNILKLFFLDFRYSRFITLIKRGI
jgi:hypothetical protein